jgi:hypothetical protein
MIKNHLFNPFSNSKLGNGRYGKYAAEHLARVQAAGLPAAVFGPRIAATTAALEAFTAGRKAGAVASAGREGKTVTFDQAIRRLQKYVSLQATVLGALFTDLDKEIVGTETAAYQAFFPLGVTHITEANKATIDAAVAPFVAAAATYQAQTGAALLTKITALVTDLTTSRAAQLTGKGETKDTQADRNIARATLATELFRNLLTLLLHHATEPALVSNYFNQAILKENTGRATDTGTGAAPTV